jgi:hypothetical protein
MNDEFAPTWLMIKHHMHTGVLYFCKTTRADPYKYNGSGVKWSSHLKKHGRHVETLWCKLFTVKAELMYCALTFSYAHQIVTSTLWANAVPEDGITGWPPGARHRLESIEKCRMNANGFKKGHVPHNAGKSNSAEHYAKQIAGQQKYRKENPNWATNWQAGRIKAEAKRIESTKKRMSGSNNWNYDATVYTFLNKHSQEMITATRNEMVHKYKCSPQNLYRVIHGKGKSVNGWHLVTI